MIKSNTIDGARLRSPLGTVPHLLDVKPSTYLMNLGVKDRIDGLYTTSRIPSGYIIQEYIGKIMTVDEADARPQCDQDYQVEVVHERSNRVSHIIDMSDAATSSSARYANQANQWRDQNAMMQQIRGRVFLVSRKVIPSGGEILTHYGDDYRML